MGAGDFISILLRTWVSDTATLAGFAGAGSFVLGVAESEISCLRPTCLLALSKGVLAFGFSSIFVVVAEGARTVTLLNEASLLASNLSDVVGFSLLTVVGATFSVPVKSVVVLAAGPELLSLASILSVLGWSAGVKDCALLGSSAAVTAMAGFAYSGLFLASASSFASTPLDSLAVLVSAGLLGSATLTDSVFASEGTEDFSASGFGYSDLASSFLAAISCCFASLSAFSFASFSAYSLASFSDFSLASFSDFSLASLSAFSLASLSSFSFASFSAYSRAA